MSTAFLVLSLFFPRLSLLGFWLFGNVPHNTTPFWLDFCLSALFPRFLVAFWIYDANEHGAGIHVLWMVAFIVLGVLEMLGGRTRVSHSESK